MEMQKLNEHSNAYNPNLLIIKLLCTHILTLSQTIMHAYILKSPLKILEMQNKSKKKSQIPLGLFGTNFYLTA